MKPPSKNIKAKQPNQTNPTLFFLLFCAHLERIQSSISCIFINLWIALNAFWINRIRSFNFQSTDNDARKKTPRKPFCLIRWIRMFYLRVYSSSDFVYHLKRKSQKSIYTLQTTNPNILIKTFSQSWVNFLNEIIHKMIGNYENTWYKKLIDSFEPDKITVIFKCTRVALIYRWLIDHWLE